MLQRKSIRRFGVFEANLSTGVLLRNGHPVKLQEKPFQLLAILLERPGEVVSKEQLRDRLWPGVRAEIDAALNTAVYNLRQALGDSAQHPRYIETAPRRGLRFVAAVASGEWSLRTKILLASSMIAILLGSVFLYDRWREAAEGESNVVVSARPLTTTGGHERDPDLSPDGEIVAFVWDSEEQTNYEVYVKRISDGHLQQLTDHPATECCPTWSPDQSQIAFLRSSDNGADLIVIPSLGGEERTVARLARMSSKLSWSSNGKHIAVEGVADDGSRGIEIVSYETGERFPVTEPPSGAMDTSPAFSPDGRTLAFARGSSTSTIAVYSVELNDSGEPAAEPKRLTRELYSMGGLDWSPDGLAVVFGSYAEDIYWRLLRIEVETEMGEAVPVGVNGRQPSFARRQAGSAVRLAYTVLAHDKNIYRIPGRTAGSTSALPPRSPELIAGSSRSDTGPRLSPTFDRIAFTSDQTGSGQLWIADLDGSNRRQLTWIANWYAGTPNWSRDGKLIAFNGLRDGNFDVFIIESDGGVPRPLTRSPAVDGGAEWSRDGRWIYFMSDRSGRPEIWKMTSAGKDPVQVTREGGYQAMESPDGKWLYYVKSIGIPGAPESLPGEGEPGVFRMPLAGGREEKVLEAGAFGRWSLSATGVYVLRSIEPDRSPSIDWFRYETWEHETIITFEKDARFGMANSLTVSLDDRWVVYAQYAYTASDLMLVHNFR